MADPDWRGGDYYGGAGHASRRRGLAVARMAAHITYLSEEGLTGGSAAARRSVSRRSFGFDADFQVESYLRYQGSSFVERFDANSYLYLTRAMDYFDIAEEHGGSPRQCSSAAMQGALLPGQLRHRLAVPDARVRGRSCTRSTLAGAPVSFVELHRPFGHDAFLLDVPELNLVVDGFRGQAHDRPVRRRRPDRISRACMAGWRQAIGRRESRARWSDGRGVALPSARTGRACRSVMHG